MNIHVRFLAISLGILTSGAMVGVAGCSSSSGGPSAPQVGGSSTSSSRSSSSSAAVDAGGAGEADAGEADAGEADAGDASHDSGTDAGDASLADGAANVLSCLTVTCELPNQACCPGFDVDGGNECLTPAECLQSANASDLYECTGPVNCPDDGDVCCVVFGGATNMGDLATCMSETTCAGYDNLGTGAVVCEEDADCAFLMNLETCMTGGGAALPTCQ